MLTVNVEAWPVNFEVPLRIGYDWNPNFTGRIKDLDHMHRFLIDIREKKRPSVPLVIHGTGGIGKTQLVREFIFMHATEFSSIIWIDARKMQNVYNSFVSLM